MKEYKVIKVKRSTFKSDLDKKLQDVLNEHARRGWEFEQMTSDIYGGVTYVVMSRKSVKY